MTERLDEKLGMARIVLDRLKDGPMRWTPADEDRGEEIAIPVGGSSDNQVAAGKRLYRAP